MFPPLTTSYALALNTLLLLPRPSVSPDPALQGLLHTTAFSPPVPEESLEVELLRAFHLTNATLTLVLSSLSLPLPDLAPITDTDSALLAHNVLQSHLRAFAPDLSSSNLPLSPFDALLWLDFALVTLTSAALFATDIERSERTRPTLALVADCAAQATAIVGISKDDLSDLFDFLQSLSLSAPALL